MESVETVVKAKLRTDTKELEQEIVRRLHLLPSARTADLRTLRREYSRRIADLHGEAVIELGLQLLKPNSFVLRFFAYELIQHHGSAPALLNSRTVRLLGEGIDSWYAVDTFACYLSGPAWRECLVPDSLIVSWTLSKDRWWRRAAVASTIALNNKARGGVGDSRRTLQICRLVVDDRDDMVVKALSWALRELAKRDRSLVEEFISENETRLAARVLREVRNKLKTGLKNPKAHRD